MEGSDRMAQAAHNQSLFREVNERLQELADTFSEEAGGTVFVCECADTGCTESCTYQSPSTRRSAAKARHSWSHLATCFPKSKSSSRKPCDTRWWRRSAKPAESRRRQPWAS